jgi:hypothetical protein
MSKPFLSVIVPVIGEHAELPVKLVDLDKKLSESEYSYEIIVSGDDSASGAGELVGRLSRNINNLRFFGAGENRGVGWMIRSGILSARGNFRLFVLSGNPAAIRKFNETLPVFKDGYQVVIGGGWVSGFGFFTEDAALGIFGAARINGWGFTGEIAALSRFFGFRIKKTDIAESKRVSAVVHPSIVWDAFRVRRWLKRGVYKFGDLREKMNP